MTWVQGAEGWPGFYVCFQEVCLGFVSWNRAQRVCPPDPQIVQTPHGRAAWDPHAARVGVCAGLETGVASGSPQLGTGDGGTPASRTLWQFVSCSSSSIHNECRSFLRKNAKEGISAPRRGWYLKNNVFPVISEDTHP